MSKEHMVRLRRWFWRWKFQQEDKYCKFCNFCRKELEQVRCLIAGPRVFICDDCVRIAVNHVIQYHKERADNLQALTQEIPILDSLEIPHD